MLVASFTAFLVSQPILAQPSRRDDALEPARPARRRRCRALPDRDRALRPQPRGPRAQHRRRHRAFAGLMFVLPGITAILPHSWGDSIDPYLPLSAGTDILAIHPDPDFALGLDGLPALPRLRAGRAGRQRRPARAQGRLTPAARSDADAVADSVHGVDGGRGAERRELPAQPRHARVERVVEHGRAVGPAGADQRAAPRSPRRACSAACSAAGTRSA